MTMIKVIPRFRRVSGPDIHNAKLEDYEALQLTNLPMEILECILDYLDGFSLNNLSLTCTTLRNLCASMLHQKGMVLLEWGKQYNSNLWQIMKKV
ncbi:F-box only protein 30-like isoform X2 [Crassostrea virginica]